MPASPLCGHLTTRRAIGVILALAATASGSSATAMAADGPGGTQAPSAGEPSQAAAHANRQASTRARADRDVHVSASRLRRMQRRLGVEADGVLGRQTRAAIRRFQSAADLAPTGRLTAETVRRLEGRALRPAAVPGPATQAVQQILAAAPAAIGTTYRPGGNGPASYDCSGLTLAVFASAGVRLPRTSFAQYRKGRAVDAEDIQPGDLVFFNTDGPGASHVGIATSARTVISATTSRGVVEHRLDDAYWGDHYLGARRIAA